MMEKQDLSWKNNHFSYGYTNKAFNPPCKGCSERTAECHAHCAKYLEFERKKLQYHEELNAQYKRANEFAGYRYGKNIRIFKTRKQLGKTMFRS